MASTPLASITVKYPPLVNYLASRLTEFCFPNLNNLDKLLGKEFLFVGAPLLLVGGSASPVRALGVILS
ncbi:MAG: hypothetical protein ABSF63_13990 [Candidatus Bathyarchaeia archaeon]